MSSRYPILDNRPIHQWKVTELKEELKRRKLTTKGLKDDLIKRLDEALRLEREAAEASDKDEAANGFDYHEAGVKDSQTGTADDEVVDTIERENAQTLETSGKGNIGAESAHTVETSGKGNSGAVEPIEKENAEKIPEVVDNEGDKNDKQDGVTVPADINKCVSVMDQEIEHTGLPAGVDSANVGEEVIAHASPVEPTITVTETALTEAVVMDQEIEHTGLPAGVDSANVGEEVIAHASTVEPTITVTETALTEAVVSGGQDSYSAEKNNEDSAIKLEKEESKAQLDSVDSKAQLECDTKPLCEDLVPNSSVPENQVSEVNISLGCQVKSDSISTDSVSINQKNELKDTIIADNVKLEQDIVRPEMVEEPSKNDVPVYDESHSMDAGGLNENKASVEENSNNNRSPDLNKINSSEDVGYPEQLNLDRSSGDDSMEEDLPESKQFDSKFNVNELGDKGESVEVPIVKEEGNSVVMEDGISPDKGSTHHDNDIPPASLVEKRKFHDHLENSVTDQASVGNDEPAKRQRRWNSETVKGSDPQIPTLRPATTPKDEPIGLKRNFSRSDSSAIDDAPKERTVPPSQRAPTNSLRIDRFLRPFTLKAVQELLGKTGQVTSFWMDQIKTHCYVTYSSFEEAIETRNAVYNLQWPPNGGRLLVAEYVDPQEVKMKLEAPPTQVASATPTQVASGSNDSTVPPAMPTSQPQPSPLQRREQPPVPATLPPPPTLSKPLPPARERLPSPPPLPEKVDQPIITLDDLFRKTRATPRIYYLPLSEEQVAAKLAVEGRSIKQ